MRANQKQSNKPLSERHEKAMVKQLILMEHSGECERNSFLTTAPARIMEEREWIKCVRRDPTGSYYTITDKGRAHLKYPQTPDKPQNDPDLLYDFHVWLRMQHGIILACWKPDSELNAVLVPSDAAVDILLRQFIDG